MPSLQISSPKTSHLPHQARQLRQSHQLILSIDTSCDDTSVAVTQNQTVISNVVSSQIDLHRPYGGVFPTVAKLAHQENIEACIGLALRKAGQLQPHQLSAVAVTQGPGLAPALEVGLKYATAFAQNHQLPLIPINHIEAHAWSAMLAPLPRSTPLQTLFRQSHRLPFLPFNPPLKPKFPLLSFVISGGHTQLILINNFGDYQILGSTLDDSAGECLDKIGRLLNLGYPAGPTIEQFAKLGDPTRFRFPLPLTTTKNYDFSFSGLKTFARNLIKNLEAKSPTNVLDQQTIYDLSASAQAGVIRHLIYKLQKLLETSLIPLEIQKQNLPAPSNSPLIKSLQAQPLLVPQVQEIWLGGGVSANIALRREIRRFLLKFNANSQLKTNTQLKNNTQPKNEIKLITPYSKKFCGDNASMIGLVASLKLPLGLSSRPDLIILPSSSPTKPLSSPPDRLPNLPLTSWL